MTSSSSSNSDQCQALSSITNLKNVIAENAKAYQGTGGQYALLDFPNHSNVGDSAIWLGELAHLEALFGSPPAFVCDLKSFNSEALRKAVPSGPIFMHGGGNFGDIWPQYQVFRESVIGQFPDRRIIQLPQTIHFTDPNLIERTATIIKRHSNFVLFVRDRRSLEIASSAFECPIYLAPDTAIFLGTIRRPEPATLKLLLLLRTDREAARPDAVLAQNLPEGAMIADWVEEDPALRRKTKIQTAMKGLFRLDRNILNRSIWREVLFRNMAQKRLDRGIELLSSAEYVVTDRLHCHILCLLLGIPHIVLDNSYGKLSSFIEAWTKDCILVRIASSLGEAIEMWSRSEGFGGA
jgi:exopolysaccharide biosynthesis predicted pyruvyltransferase EpsI